VESVDNRSCWLFVLSLPGTWCSAICSVSKLKEESSANILGHLDPRRMYRLRLSVDWRLLSHDEVPVLEALEGVPNLQEVQNETARLGDSLEREVEAVLQCLDVVIVDVCVRCNKE
jgi:hypothetical protein